MGSTDGESSERPVHTVHLSQPFYMGKYPVTQEQWEAVMGENPSHFKGADRPVEQVSWEEAQEFVRRLTEQETGVSYRLPSEAEWEYAARAGSSTAYCFGDNEEQLGEYGWYRENAGGETHPVGQRKANSWGLHDMHGNVWEWVEDWYGAYSAEPVPDPHGPSSGSYRVIRGGCWDYGAWYCRSSYRICGEPGSRDRYLGFRVLRPAS
jgi:formylglycine-generating enzyme required for sulfatase activity